MPEQLLKNFSIEIQQKLYEKDTPHGSLAVYQTEPFGMMITINGKVMMSEYDSFFYHEMMAHPALFTHPKPEKVVILGHAFGILQEVLKHPAVKEITCVDDNQTLQEVVSQYFSYHQSDARVKQLAIDSKEWLSQCGENTFDIIIQAEQSDDFLEDNFKHYFNALSAEGILVKPFPAPLFQLKTLKPIYQNIHHAGFHDSQLLNFPQPSYPSGWRTLIMSTKRHVFKRLREMDVFNRPFTTRYYNFDVHKAAQVLPEFVRVEWEKMA